LPGEHDTWLGYRPPRGSVLAVADRLALDAVEGIIFGEKEAAAMPPQSRINGSICIDLLPCLIVTFVGGVYNGRGRLEVRMKLLFKQRFFSWFDSYDIYQRRVRRNGVVVTSKQKTSGQV